MTGEALTNRISVVYLCVTDVNRSLDFHRGLFGIPLEADSDDPHWAEASLDGNIRFAIHLAGEGSMPQSSRRASHMWLGTGSSSARSGSPAAI
jgi:hypothetical protein